MKWSFDQFCRSALEVWNLPVGFFIRLSAESVAAKIQYYSLRFTHEAPAQFSCIAVIWTIGQYLILYSLVQAHDLTEEHNLNFQPQIDAHRL